MGGIPDLMFVIDTNKEAIAIQEARKLGIPVVAILDTNCDPDGITFPIPGNDDAARAIQLYCDLIADAVWTAWRPASGDGRGSGRSPSRWAGRCASRASRRLGLTPAELLEVAAEALEPQRPPPLKPIAEACCQRALKRAVAEPSSADENRHNFRPASRGTLDLLDMDA